MRALRHWVDTMPARGEGGDDVPRTRYKALRMNASPEFASCSDEIMGIDTSVHTTSDKTRVGDDLPRHRSLRMNNASPRLRGSVLQAKELSCMSWSSARYSPSKSTAMEEDSGDREY